MVSFGESALRICFVSLPCELFVECFVCGVDVWIFCTQNCSTKCTYKRRQTISPISQEYLHSC